MRRNIQKKLKVNINSFKKLAATIAVICLAAIFGFGQKVDFAQVKASDLNAKEIQPLTNVRSKAIVFLFVETDCPISNRYAPEIKRLYDKYNSDVTFWLVYPDKDDSARAIRRHLKEYGYKIRILRDSRHELVKAAGVNVTPEAAVFISADDGEVRMVYRGRIDDLVAAFGKSRSAPTSHDLDEILGAIISGKSVTLKTTTAIGCSIADLD